ncbi:outer membrane protein assembly factor BamD [Opitutaceae bacterium EW11]|nr:outer membrane protein assembly factor BamD [Opitutaceae bacterium EW11]
MMFLLRRFTLGFALLAFFATLSGRLAADLVWSPQTGWRIEGGVLSGLTGPEGRNAVDLMNKARAAEERGSNRTAIKYYQRVAKKYPNSVYAPEALYRTGKLQLARKQYSKSFESFQAVVARYPNTARFNEIIGEQYRIASALLDGARGRILWIFPGFTNREKSIGYFELILINAPYSDYAPLALMNVARAHQKMKNTEEAIDALDRMINNYPQSLLAPDAYLKLAETHASLVDGPEYDQESTRNAVTYFEDFMILYPSDNNVPKAEKGLAEMKKVLAESKMKMADFYFYKRDNYKAARVFYNEAITVYPDSEVAAKARQRLTEVDTAQAKASQPGAKKKKRFWLF